LDVPIIQPNPTMKFTATIIALVLAPTVGALQRGYLSQMGGGGSLKASSVKPVTAGRPAFGGTYLDQMAKSAPAIPAPAVPVAPAAAVVPAAPASAASFSLSQSVVNASPVAVGNYLSSLRGAGAPSGSGPRGYLDTLRIQAAATAATNLPGYLDTLRVASAPTGAGPLTYLDNIAGASRVTAKVEATTAVTLTSNEPILAAINKLKEDMTSNQKHTIGILQEINSSVQKLVAYTAASAPVAAAAPVQAAPVAAAPVLIKEAAPTASGYLSSLKSGSAPPKGSGPSGYLDSLRSGETTELISALEATATTKRAPTASGYLASLR
jgi:hypothetical protein